jgi:hypothetical protein
MKYFNWQKLCKQIFSDKTNTPQKDQSQTAEPLETLHQRAWAELSLYCLREELEKLLKLAHQYETGQRLHDTHFISEKAV